MKKLLHGLVALSSLRDRDQLDLAVLLLLGQTVIPHVLNVRWVSLVGQADDPCWFIHAWLDVHSGEAKCSNAWPDVANLLRRDAVPRWSAALKSNTIFYSGQGPYLSVFTIPSPLPVCRLLEIETFYPLEPDALVSIQQILEVYQNLQSLFDYGEKDTLTDLLNRKTFDRAFSRAATELTATAYLGQFERRQGDTSLGFWLAMLDVDHFKKVNDNYGHLIGDEVLLLLANLMRDSFRFDDQLYRFGGEEFVVLMRHANQADAAMALNRFRVAVEQHVFPQVGTITVSIGFCPLIVNDTPSSAIGRADKAVYYVKGNGRNQVCNYDQLVADGYVLEVSEDVNEADFF